MKILLVNIFSSEKPATVNLSYQIIGIQTANGTQVNIVVTPTNGHYEVTELLLKV